MGKYCMAFYYITVGIALDLCNQWIWSGMVWNFYDNPSKIFQKWHPHLTNYVYCFISRVGNSLIGFLSESLVFCKKMSKWAIWSLLIFGEQPERLTHISHQKWGNERIAHFFKNLLKKRKNTSKNTILVNFFWAIRSYAHLSWATRANRSQSLFCHDCS